MLTSKESFEHGEHNQKACDLLHVNGFPDWTITTAFYASLHFVTSKIFPFEYKNGNEKIEFVDISQWQQFKSYTSKSRHILTKELVEKYCEDIVDEYEWLMSTSFNARYHTHSHPPEVVNLSISYMKKIKKFCEPKKHVKVSK
ncbi:MAG: hypothetical protein ACTHM7_14140 [Ginsengibacter sp.]